jgi:lipoate-protein ligase A
LEATVLFVENDEVTDPRLNLALEEHLLRNAATDEDLLLFYINEPSVLLGRNQNTWEEINRDYVEAHNLHVVRRLSGGGAVYHDLGNLNFSFILRRGKENLVDYRGFTAPVVKALVEMGIPAEFDGRNGLLLHGRKISGCASYSTATGRVAHGTLLFDADLARLAEALDVQPGQIVSKSIKSVRSRVANIREYLKEPMDMGAFRAGLLQGLLPAPGAIPRYPLTGEDWTAIRVLSEARYQRWEWNWGRSPEFDVHKTQRFPMGEIDARIKVQNGEIRSIQLHGDFFRQRDLAVLQERLSGVRYDRASLAQALRDENVGAYFGDLPVEEFVAFLY